MTAANLAAPRARAAKLGVMRRQTWVLGIAAFLLVAGGVFFTSILWLSIDAGAAFGPHLIGAALGGILLRRIVGGGRAIRLAVGGALGWMGAQLLAHHLGGSPVAVETTTATYLLL